MFGSNPNTMDIMAVWDKIYQITHYKRPVYKFFASERLAPMLEMGDTVHRTYASDFYVNDMGGDGSYSTQALVDTDETLIVNKKKEVSFYLPKWQTLQFQLPVQKKYGTKAMYRLWNQVDGDLLAAMQQGTNNAQIDDGTLGGTTGNGVNLSVANVAEIFYQAIDVLLAVNTEYQPGTDKFSGNVQKDTLGQMLGAAIPSRLYHVLLSYLGGKNSAFGDKVSMNGHAGRFADFDLFVSNNLPWEATLQIPTNPTANDTVTIGGLLFTFVSAIGTTAGNVLIAGSAAGTATNLQALLAAPYTTTANGVGFTQASLTTAQVLFLSGLTATLPTTTTVKVYVQGVGSAVVASVLTSTNNSWPVGLQKTHAILGLNKSIDLIMQQTPNLYINPVTGKVGRDFVTWNLYGYKMFTEQKPQIVDVVLQSSAFIAPTQVTN
jgi:hypothetical protein